MKEHAIIEKTAAFVSQHGSQMEIVIKTKQKNNPQFRFLDFDSELNAYYKHVVSAIKSGKYKPLPPSRKTRRDSKCLACVRSSLPSCCSPVSGFVSGDSENPGYLHPSLSKTANQAQTAASRQVNAVTFF